MKTIVFDIDTDGDFNHAQLFTMFAHPDAKTRFEKTMENLYVTGTTIDTGGDAYISKFKEIILEFCLAYMQHKLKKYADYQFNIGYTTKDWDLDFNLDYGNWHIRAYLADHELEVLDDGFLIK